MRAGAVAAILLAGVLAPLSFFDFAGDRSQNHVAPEAHAGALQRANRLQIAHQRAFHVVDAQAENHAILHYGVRLVADAGEKRFVPAVGRVHVAVEHEALAIARTFPQSYDISSTLF